MHLKHGKNKKITLLCTKSSGDLGYFLCIKFYTNLGAQKLDYDYFYPSGKGPLPMDLYYLPYKGILPEHIDADIKETFAIIHSDIEYLNSSIQ